MYHQLHIHTDCRGIVRRHSKAKSQVQVIQQFEDHLPFAYFEGLHRLIRRLLPVRLNSFSVHSRLQIDTSIVRSYFAMEDSKCRLAEVHLRAFD